MFPVVEYLESSAVQLASSSCDAIFPGYFLQSPCAGCQSHVAPLSEPAGISQGIDEVNETKSRTLRPNGLPLTAFFGRYRNHSDLIASGQNMNRMLSFPVVLFAFVLSGFGCAKPVSQVAPPASQPVEAAVDVQANVTASAPFAGSWESCAGAESPEQCSRYLLVQRGKRICGTWSYFASGDSYEGRVMAEAISPVEARRTGICGRPGSETSTECEAGWDTIDRPLRLCSGKLGDLDSKDGRCFADFERVEHPGPSLENLAAQSWVEVCLSRKEEKSK